MLFNLPTYLWVVFATSNVWETNPSIEKRVKCMCSRQLGDPSCTQYQKAQKNVRAPVENRTPDPPSSRSDALMTELLEALWRAGSSHLIYKSNYNC